MPSIDELFKKKRNSTQGETCSSVRNRWRMLPCRENESCTPMEEKKTSNLELWMLSSENMFIRHSWLLRSEQKGANAFSFIGNIKVCAKKTMFLIFSAAFSSLWRWLKGGWFMHASAHAEKGLLWRWRWRLARGCKEVWNWLIVLPIGAARTVYRRWPGARISCPATSTPDRASWMKHHSSWSSFESRSALQGPAYLSLSKDKSQCKLC